MPNARDPIEEMTFFALRCSSSSRAERDFSEDKQLLTVRGRLGPNTSRTLATPHCPLQTINL